MTVREIGHGSHRYVWDTADTKPTATTHGCSVGDTGYDRQTGIMYITYDGTNWVEKDTIVRLETSPTIDIGDVQIHDSAGSEVLGTLTASPTASNIKLTPGPDVAVIDFAPVHEAPITLVMAAISSSY